MIHSRVIYFFSIYLFIGLFVFFVYLFIYLFIH